MWHLKDQSKELPALVFSSEWRVRAGGVGVSTNTGAHLGSVLVTELQALEKDECEFIHCLAAQITLIPRTLREQPAPGQSLRNLWCWSC